MHARVITAQAGAGGFDDVISLAEQQLSVARQEPGFAGYYVLTDSETGKLMVISLWDSREQMEAVAADRVSGIRDEGVQDTGVSSLVLETYEVSLLAGTTGPDAGGARS